MQLLVRHSWIGLVIVVFITGQQWFSHAQALTRADPELGPGYRRLYVGYLLSFNWPWLLAGFGVLSGRISSLTDVMHPVAGKPFVLVWWAGFAALFALGSLWIYLAGGAEMLARHPGVYMVPRWTAPQLKLFWLGCVVWNAGIGAVALRGTGSALSSTWLVILTPIGIAAGLIWVSFLLAGMGGWNVLAASYRAPGEFDGERLSFRSASFGYIDYASSLTIGTNAQGLYLAAMPLFRIAHPPLLIPWTDVSTRETKVWFWTAVDFTFARAPTVSVRMRQALAAAVLKGRNI